MKEIEVKILEIDKAIIIKRIKALGGKKTFEGVIEAAYFDTRDRMLKKQGKVLRLRKKGDQIELTLKLKITTNKVKSVDEYETIVSDYDSMYQILVGLGYHVTSTYTKKRVSYATKDAHFEVDEFPGAPPFLEIESTSQKTVLGYVTKLGFSAEEALPWTGKDVLKHYGLNQEK